VNNIWQGNQISLLHLSCIFSSSLEQLTVASQDVFDSLSHSLFCFFSITNLSRFNDEGIQRHEGDTLWVLTAAEQTSKMQYNNIKGGRERKKLNVSGHSGQESQIPFSHTEETEHIIISVKTAKFLWHQRKTRGTDKKEEKEEGHEVNEGRVMTRGGNTRRRVSLWSVQRKKVTVE
jgi:hypothetical protein